MIDRARTDRPRVLHAAPSARTQGGVSTLIRLLQGSPLWAEWSVRHIATHRDGTVATKVLTFVGAFGRFCWSLLAWRPELVHLHMSSHGSFVRKAVLFWVAKAARVPVVLHVHGGYDAFYDNAPEVLKSAIRATFTHATVVVALGERWARRLRTIAPHARVVAIPNAVRIHQPSPQPATGEPVHVVFLGWIAESKGAFNLIAAWEQIMASPGRASAARLTMAGNREVERARRQVAESRLTESVQVRDWLSPAEVTALLDSAHVLVLPSVNEGQPMAVLEAMAHGLCVVATPVGGVPELVVDETSGLLVPHSDLDALTAALERVIQDAGLRARLGAAAHARARERFDIEVVWRRFDAVYRAVLAPGGPQLDPEVGAAATETGPGR